ncbi:hypothetical protein D9M71_527620 [compost metagenome]
MTVELEGRTATTTVGQQHVATEWLARLGVEHRCDGVATDQVVAVGHVRVGNVRPAVAVGMPERRIRGHAEAVPQRFATVVDGHAGVVFRIVRDAHAFRRRVLHRTAVGPTHVQALLPDHGKIAERGLPGRLYRRRGTTARIFGPCRRHRQHTHGGGQALLRLLDDVGREQV